MNKTLSQAIRKAVSEYSPKINEKNIEKFLKIPENQQRFFDDMLSEKLFIHLREFSIVKVDEKKSDELRKEQGVSHG